MFKRENDFSVFSVSAFREANPDIEIRPLFFSSVVSGQ